MPTGSGINLTDRYMYQQHMVAHHIDPDDDDGGDL
jgi:hypothetical protein